MSHFTVLVIGPDVNEQLAPFHEFEYTGSDDQYVQDIDQTEEARKEYESATTTKYKDDTGVLHDPYLDRFYREPTPEEEQKIGPLCGTGGNNTISWHSKDWEDGKGYRAKVHFLPDGWEEIEVPTREAQSFADFIEGYYGHEVVPFGENPDLRKTHKYGYTIVDKNGEVLRTIDRTNPNKKWDDWVVGGRWNGFFKLKTGHPGALGTASMIATMNPDYKPPLWDHADVCLKGSIDIEGMRDEAGRKAAETYDLFTKITSAHPRIVPWSEVRAKHGDGNIGAARAEYWKQHGVNALREYKDAAQFDPDDFNCTRSEYIDRARQGALSTFAVVKDGKWYERGEMGWWGIVHNEKESDKWETEFSDLLDRLPDDTLLTVVDCHI